MNPSPVRRGVIPMALDPGRAHFTKLPMGRDSAADTLGALPTVFGRLLLPI
jgi:hypothetical protein